MSTPVAVTRFEPPSQLTLANGLGRLRPEHLRVSGSRRRALALALGAALAPLVAREEAAAHNPLKACQKKSGKQKKKCLKKAKQHTAQHAAAPAPQSPLTGAGPGPRRTTMTRTFRNTTAITILPGPDDGTAAATPANPYPSLIEVAGFANGRILDLNLTLHGLSHTFPGDVDILLAAAHLPGLNARVMSDTGGRASVSDVTLTLDDQAAAELPRLGGFASGTFKPTNHLGSGAEEFPAPAPAPSGNVGLRVFTGSDPNGTWQLFVVDDVGRDGGSIANGWSLEITAEVDA